MKANAGSKTFRRSKTRAGDALRQVIRIGGAATPVGLFHHPTFTCAGHTMDHYVHTYNLGYPPFRMTERSIELAVADLFLTSKGPDVVEIGAVTPYYWPKRVRTIIDPADLHQDVTHRCGWQNWPADDRPLLSISTFEHMGTGEYGVEANVTVHEAFAKLVATTADFLITFPPGYNRALDKSVADCELASHRIVGIGWTRGTRGNNWREIPLPELLGSHPTYGATGATALAMLIRSEDLSWLRG